MHTMLSRSFNNATQAQRSGVSVDAETLKHSLEVCQSAIELALQAKPEVQEAFLKTAQQACQAKKGSSHLIVTLYQDPAFRQWLFGIVGVVGGTVALNKNIIELWKIFTERNKVKQKAIQENLNIADLTDLSKVTKFCEALPPITLENETPEKMQYAEEFITGIKAQLASGENQRGSSIAKTANANISGLWIKKADANAVYGDKKLEKQIRAIEASRVSYNKNGQPYKDKATIVKHRKLVDENATIYLKSRVNRTNLPSLQEFRKIDGQQVKRVKRFQGERLKAQGSRLSDSDWRDAMLLRADFSGAYLELMDLALADLRLLKASGATFKRTTLTDADVKGLQAPKSEWGGVNGDYADFSFAYSTGVDKEYRLYKQSDLNGAIFHHVVTDPITFKYTPVRNSFDGADFRGAQFKETQLVDFTARWANFTRPTWKPLELVKSKAFKGLIPEALKIPHSDWEAYDKQPVDFTGATFETVNLEGSNLSEARFANVQTTNHRLSIHKIVPNGQPPRPELNEVSQVFTHWLRPFKQACPPVNLKDTNLKKTTWNDTVLNRKQYQHNWLESSFDFAGAFSDEADFRKAKIIDPFRRNVFSIEDAIVQSETNPALKSELKRVLGKMHYEKELPIFHSDKKKNEGFVGEVLEIVQMEMKKND
jgi:uncharacterized protein YjbI with pentapeptide repeats